MSYMLLISWSARNYKRSIRREYEERFDAELEKANLRSLAQELQISQLDELLQLSTDSVFSLNQRLYNTIRRRDSKGRFVKI